MATTDHQPFDYQVQPYSLVKMIPPRTGEKTLAATKNLLGSLSDEEHTLSLELVGSPKGVTLMHRSEGSDNLFRRLFFGHFPTARLDEIDPKDDPMVLRDDEEAWTCTMRVEGPPYVPLRIYNDQDIQADHGSDPMAAVVAAHANLGENERVISRLVLKPLARDWSERYKRMGLGGAGSHNQAQSIEEQREKSKSSPSSSSSDEGDSSLPIIGVIAVIAVAAVLGYQKFQDLTQVVQVLLGLSGALMVAALVVGYAMWMFKRKKPEEPDFADPAMVSTRIDSLAFAAEIQVTVIQARRRTRTPKSMGRAAGIMRGLVQAFKHFDHPEGSKLVPGEIQRYTGSDDYFQFLAEEEQSSGFFSLSPKSDEPQSVIGLNEVASMWHLPTKEDISSSFEKSFGHDLAPPPGLPTEGAYVGDTTIGAPQKIMFSPDITKRHQFFIARTRMGKSTLIEHCVAYKMRQKANGLNDDAIVVVDPHSDLINSLLRLVPKGLEKRVWLIDLSDSDHVPGINLLDSHIFPDRDHTCDGVIRVTKGIWENWGSRMQNILEHTIKSLHEANSHPDTPREKQYTLLDGMRMLSQDDFRREVLEKVDDIYLQRYWHEEFDKMRPQLRQEAVAPVQTRLAYFGSSKKAREILGQRSSTLDIRQAIDNGDIIFVNTAQGEVGRDVAALVGASILNLVDAVIRQQARKAAEDRRGVYVVVDEMQTIPGVDFPGMLSEVGKFGGALCLVTQSLSAMQELGDTMRDVVLANIGCLVVFQVAAVDAQKLVWELGKERVSEDDITSLPAHHAYVRVTSEGLRIPTFTMRLRYPQQGDPQMAERVRELSVGYTKTADEVERLMKEEDFLAKEAENERNATTETNMENGVVFEDMLTSIGRQQKTINGRARARRRRNSRLHPHEVETGGLNTKSVVGSTGKKGGDNLGEEREQNPRELTTEYFEKD